MSSPAAAMDYHTGRDRQLAIRHRPRCASDGGFHQMGRRLQPRADHMLTSLVNAELERYCRRGGRARQVRSSRRRLYALRGPLIRVRLQCGCSRAHSSKFLIFARPAVCRAAASIDVPAAIKTGRSSAFVASLESSKPVRPQWLVSRSLRLPREII